MSFASYNVSMETSSESDEVQVHDDVDDELEEVDPPPPAASVPRRLVDVDVRLRRKRRRRSVAVEEVDEGLDELEEVDPPPPAASPVALPHVDVNVNIETEMSVSDFSSPLAARPPPPDIVSH